MKRLLATLVAVASYPVSDGLMKFEVRLTSYDRDDKDKAYRNAVFTSCTLLTINGVSTANPSNELQVFYAPRSEHIYHFTFVEKDSHIGLYTVFRKTHDA